MISFVYRNYKGETEIRHVTPLCLEWIAKPGFSYQPGWFLTGYDRDRDNAVRSFALSHIILPNGLEAFTLWGEPKPLKPYIPKEEVK